MPAHIGKQALVVGAGMGGLTAARALADHFERVLVLERDALPEQAEDRSGVLGLAGRWRNVQIASNPDPAPRLFAKHMLHVPGAPRA